MNKNDLSKKFEKRNVLSLIGKTTYQRGIRNERGNKITEALKILKESGEIIGSWQLKPRENERRIDWFFAIPLPNNGKIEAGCQIKSSSVGAEEHFKKHHKFLEEKCNTPWLRKVAPVVINNADIDVNALVNEFRKIIRGFLRLNDLSKQIRLGEIEFEGFILRLKEILKSFNYPIEIIKDLRNLSKKF